MSRLYLPRPSPSNSCLALTRASPLVSPRCYLPPPPRHDHLPRLTYTYPVPTPTLSTPAPTPTPPEPHPDHRSDTPPSTPASTPTLACTTPTPPESHPLTPADKVSVGCISFILHSIFYASTPTDKSPTSEPHPDSHPSTITATPTLTLPPLPIPADESPTLACPLAITSSAPTPEPHPDSHPSTPSAPAPIITTPTPSTPPPPRLDHSASNPHTSVPRPTTIYLDTPDTPDSRTPGTSVRRQYISSTPSTPALASPSTPHASVPIRTLPPLLSELRAMPSLPSLPMLPPLVRPLSPVAPTLACAPPPTRRLRGSYAPRSRIPFSELSDSALLLRRHQTQLRRRATALASTPSDTPPPPESPPPSSVSSSSPTTTVPVVSADTTVCVKLCISVSKVCKVIYAYTALVILRIQNLRFLIHINSFVYNSLAPIFRSISFPFVCSTLACLLSGMKSGTSRLIASFPMCRDPPVSPALHFYCRYSFFRYL